MMRRLFFAVSLVLCWGLGGTVEAKSLVDTATEAGTFTLFLTAAKTAGITPLLNGDGPITLFAPTDDAFAKLPKGTLENLLKPDNREDLRMLIMRHIVIGRIVARDFMGRRMEAATVDGSLLLIDATKTVMIGDAKLVKADIAADNGIIHVIDTVVPAN